jgi:hypothetical protein
VHLTTAAHRKQLWAWNQDKRAKAPSPSHWRELKANIGFCRMTIKKGKLNYESEQSEFGFGDSRHLYDEL